MSRPASGAARIMTPQLPTSPRAMADKAREAVAKVPREIPD
jgi:hypothetical protein